MISPHIISITHFILRNNSKKNLSNKAPIGYLKIYPSILENLSAEELACSIHKIKRLKVSNK